MTSGVPISYIPGGTVERLLQIDEEIVLRQGLEPGPDPTRADHDRKALGERAQHLERDAPGPEYHGGPKLDHLDPDSRSTAPTSCRLARCGERSSCPKAPR